MFYSRAYTYLFSSFISLALGLFSVNIGSRFLDTSHYGMSALILSWGAFLGTLSSLGIPFLISSRNRFINPDINSNILTYLLFSSLVSVILVLILWTLSVYFFPFSIPVSINYFFAFVLIESISILSWNIVSVALINEGLAARVAFYSILKPTVSLITLAIFVHFAEPNYFVLPLSAAAGGVMQALMLFSFAGHASLFHLYPKAIIEVLIKSSKMAVSASAESGARVVDRSIIGNFLGISSVGILSHASIYSSAFQMAVRSMSQAAWPSIRNEIHKNLEPLDFTDAYVRILSYLMFTFNIMFVLFGEMIIKIIGNGIFGDSYYIGCWLIYAVSIRLSARKCHAFIVSHGKVGPASLINIFSTAAGVLTLIPLVYVIGLNGVAFSVIASSLTYFTLTTWYGSKAFSIKLEKIHLHLFNLIILLVLTFSSYIYVVISCISVLFIGFYVTFTCSKRFIDDIKLLMVAR